MNMHAGLCAQETQIVRELFVILPALDASAHLRIESLNPDLELKRAGRKPGDHFTKSIRQAVWNHLKVEKQAGLIAREKEFEDRFARVQIQVERPIDKFEMLHAALQKAIQRGKKLLQRKRPDRNLERREAKLTSKRTPPRRFDI